MSGARAERWVLPAIALATAALHLATANIYGIFRDEYYYIACANRLAWGYVDHPPLSIAVLTLWQAIFGDGQFALRVVPALVGAGAVYLGGAIAKEMRGGTFAQAVAALAFLVAPVFRGVTSYYSMNVFDHFFWALAIWVLVRIINSGNGRWWLVFGVVCGIGLLNKISLLFLGFGLVVGMVLTPERKHFKDWRLYAGGTIALVIFLPHVVWEMRNDWAMVEFTRNAALYKNAPLGVVGFFLSQLLMMNPLGAPLWIAGTIAGLLSPTLRPYRPLAILFVAVFLLLSLSYGKDYYLAPAFFAVMPLAAVWVEHISKIKARWLRVAVPAAQLGSFVLLAPLALPILPIETFLKYQAFIGIKPPASEQRVNDEVPQHFSDRFGWEEMAVSVKAAVEKLTPEQRAKVVIVAGNYGEAYALEYYAAKYGLPKSYTAHNNGFLWGPPPGNGEVVIVVNAAEPEELAQLFGKVEEIGWHRTPIARGSEREFPIYVCTEPKVSWSEAWKRHYI